MATRQNQTSCQIATTIFHEGAKDTKATKSLIGTSSDVRRHKTTLLIPYLRNSTLKFTMSPALAPVRRK